MQLCSLVGREGDLVHIGALRSNESRLCVFDIGNIPEPQDLVGACGQRNAAVAQKRQRAFTRRARKGELAGRLRIIDVPEPEGWGRAGEPSIVLEIPPCGVEDVASVGKEEYLFTGQVVRALKSCDLAQVLEACTARLSDRGCELAFVALLMIPRPRAARWLPAWREFWLASHRERASSSTVREDPSSGQVAGGSLHTVTIVVMPRLIEKRWDESVNPG